MSQTATIETLAELLDQLGHIPLERIRMQPPPGTATESDILTAEAGSRKRLCELIDGVLVEKVMGFCESVLAGFLFRCLDDFVRPRNLGILTTADGMVRLWPGRVRIPDVAFISWERVPGRRMPTEPIPDLAPDLIAEVLSVGNTAAEMERKRQEYFQAGVRLVWEIDPASRTMKVYVGTDDFRTLTEADILDGGAVLAGFSLPLAALFAELDRHA